LSVDSSRSRHFGSSDKELPQDWSEFLSLLVGQWVRFLLVGGHAMAAHGAPRFTGDLDVWV
jgi:hypothetical protein